MILPLSLKLLGAAGLLLVILFIFWKKKRKYIWPLGVMVVGLGIWQGLKEYNRKNPDLADVKADIKIAAVDLIREYEVNDSASNRKFLGKILEIKGQVKEVRTDEKGFYTIVLGDTGSMSSVRCAMDTVHQQDAAKLSIGTSTTVKGACTGFNKDEMGLGSDVILNRCVIVASKNNE
jgi:hypothetical protein